MNYDEETMMQDAADSPDTTYTMSVGKGFVGNLEDRADEDWVLVELKADTTYKIEAAGHGPDGASDTILKILNSRGGLIDENDDVDLAKGMLNSALTFHSQETGSYYLSVSSYRGNPTKDYSGAYKITVMEVPPITGTDLADLLTGSEEGEKIAGMEGDDSLSGAGGSDFLEGGAGNDTLTGGAGPDIFVFSPDDGDGADIITDFSRTDDRLNLSAFGIEELADLYPYTSPRDGSTVIDLTSLDGGTILLEGIASLNELEPVRDDFSGIMDATMGEIVVIYGITFIL